MWERGGRGLSFLLLRTVLSNRFALVGILSRATHCLGPCMARRGVQGVEKLHCTYRQRQTGGPWGTETALGSVSSDSL